MESNILITVFFDIFENVYFVLLCICDSTPIYLTAYYRIDNSSRSQDMKIVLQ